MIAYFDTSAFVKLLIAEPGSTEVARIWDAATVAASSVLLYTEARAALARARREQRLGPAEVRAAINELDSLWTGLTRVVPSTSLAERAGVLADDQNLRGYDAVHLASAEAISSRDLVLVAADGPLCSAARRLGLAVARIPRLERTRRPARGKLAHRAHQAPSVGSRAAPAHHRCPPCRSASTGSLPRRRLSPTLAACT